MNNGQLTRWLDEVQRRIDGRLRDHADDVKADLAEHLNAVNRDVDRIDGRVAEIQKKCVGCAGEFGALKEKAANCEKALADHVVAHRWRVGIAAAIGGTVSAIVFGIINLAIALFARRHGT